MQFFDISSSATLKETFAAKYEHPKRDQNLQFTPLSETTSIPALSYGSPPPLLGLQF